MHSASSKVLHRSATRCAELLAPIWEQLMVRSGFDTLYQATTVA